MQRDICIDRLKKRALHHKDEAAYFFKQKNSWQGVNWEVYHDRVVSFAKSLINAGVDSGGKIAILGFNRLEWLIAAVGSQYIGATSVGVYTSSSADEVFYVVDHSDAEVLIVENLERYRKQIKPKVDQFKKIKLIVLMSEEKTEDENVLKWSEFLQAGKTIKASVVDEKFSAVDPNSIATMIYTSGTTGNPKSVMLSHASIAWTVQTMVQVWGCSAKDKEISYLPLAHIAEQMLTIYAPIDCGISCYFVESPEKFKSNLKEVEPTVFFGVPRVYEKIYEGIKGAISEKDALSQKVLMYFRESASEYFSARYEGKMPSLWTSLRYLLARQKIFPKIKEQIGLGKVRICAVGAAPISKDILNFFSSIDIPIYELYGQSENCGPTTLSLPNSTKIGSVGKVMPGAEVKIASDGEILLKGPHIFLGYYKDPAATAEVVKEGWLYTGDVGSLDKDGFLTITDRKKDILITAGGKNISPQNIESMLKHLPYVQS
ncbi:MAG: AMP-binding protein, partial [Myxococcales bacterium]|nr:AMP-binding protein [Myxococcales bacterium]